MDVLCIKLPKGYRFSPADQELIDSLRLNLSVFGGEIDVSSTNLPKGYRFNPTDRELIDYLQLKIEGKKSEVEFPEVDIYNWEPSELPSLSKMKNDDRKWYFFCCRRRKHPKSHRSSRQTKGGFWKSTSKDRQIMSSSSVGKKLIGFKKTLTFYSGHAGKDQKIIDWKIYEYRMTNSAQHSLVLCCLVDENKNTEHSNSGVIDPTDSFPTTTKSSSSPEGMLSNQTMVQETLWLDDESDHMRSDAYLHKEIDANNHMASHVEDEAAQMITYEVDFPDAPTLETSDLKISSPLSSDLHNGEGYYYPKNSAIAFNNDMQFQDTTDEYDTSYNKFCDVFLNDTDVQVAQEQVKAKPPIVSEQLLSSPLPSDIHTGGGSSYPDNSAIAFNNGFQFQDSTDDCDSSCYKFWNDLLNDINAQAAQEQVKAKPVIGSEGLLCSTSP